MNTGCTEKTDVTVIEKIGKLSTSTDVEQGAPADTAVMNNSDNEILNAEGIFTAAEKAEIGAGADAKVWVKVDDLEFLEQLHLQYSLRGTRKRNG